MIDTKSLREMPSSLNDACRKMELAADCIDLLRAPRMIMKTGTEIIAREIALFHGSAMIVGNQTLAATRGYGSWGHSPEKYADAHWREYIGAAEVMLARINQISDAEPLPRS